MRWISGFLSALFLYSGLASANTLWQPVTDYSISFPGERLESPPPINPFENFTHFAGDFGWMGPGQERIEASAGSIRIKPGEEWTGAWHSLAGLASERDRTFDPSDLTGLGGPQETRANVVAAAITVRGRGQLKLELADAEKRVVWSTTLEIQPNDPPKHHFQVDAAALGRLKFYNWIAEPGSEVFVSSIGFHVEEPAMSGEEWLFRTSLGKLRRCHDRQSGFTRDRAHIPAGSFDSVTATGLHALALAVAGAEGIVAREQAIEEVRMTTAGILQLPRASGFLPHFTHQGPDGGITIHPNTEYSTVDTAITLHALLLAGRILELEDVCSLTGRAISELNFDQVTDPDGWISHGFETDGATPLLSRWHDWGGETALILALEAMIPNRPPRGRMEESGRVFRGVQFIAELQSLFYPDFDRPEADAVSGVSWPASRRELYLQQVAYVPQQWPDAPAAREGIFGVSAGEIGMPGEGYTANGVDVPGIRWLHPHAMIMASALTARENFSADIQRLRSNHLLLPMGLPENVEIGLRLDNPMQGSLNAGFETIAAYHGWKGRGVQNLIDRASQQDPLLRKGAARFYP